MISSTLKERPILASSKMINAIREHGKRETRRALNPQPVDAGSHQQVDCPYGKPGDLLWVRESFTSWEGEIIYKADCKTDIPPEYRASGLKWTPSIYMPKALSRMTLRITDVKVELLGAITTQGIIAEGIPLIPIVGHPQRAAEILHRHQWIDWWDEINRKTHPWNSNPWVWVVSFEEVPRV